MINLSLRQLKCDRWFCGLGLRDSTRRYCVDKAAVNNDAFRIRGILQGSRLRAVSIFTRFRSATTLAHL
jgi:hypothetical protein